MELNPTKKKIKAEIALASCVAVLSEDYPLGYGNYFALCYPCQTMSVCNFNYENFKEARKRFLTDREVEITIFDNSNGWKFCAITDERIPQDWYGMWSESQGYCNGGIAGEEWQEVVNYIGNRYTNLEKTDDKKTTV